MPFLSGPALWLIVGLLFTNGVAGVMWWVNSAKAEHHKAVATTCAQKHAAFVEQTRDLGKQAERRTAEIIARNNQTTEKASHDYQANLDRLRADYQRLRQQYVRAGGGAVPAVSVSTRSLDDLPADALPLAAACAETTLTLVALQDWVKDVAK